MKCALCGNEAKLMQSHIIPKLVYKRIRSHKNSRFRSLDNFTRIMQDGEKRPMLCHDCEELFSSYEVKFASGFLDDYLNTNKIKHNLSGEIENYLLTVAWRILWDDLYRLNSHANHFTREIFEEFCKELSDYLLSIGANNNSHPPEKFKTHIYKLESLIKSDAVLELAKGTIFGYSFYESKDYSIAVIVYYAGLVFVTYYNYDKMKYMFIGQRPIIFKRLARRKIITEELQLQFSEMAQQYLKVLTPELQKSIQNYYKKH
nr:hypothetical protein [uncultured Agathobacter sp.]